MVLLFADLDDFKAINDTRGHQEGDRALRAMADVFRQNFRDSDIIARMSGDEFAILLADMTEDNVRVIRNRLDQDIEAFNARMNGSHRLSVSIGMAVHNHDTPSSIDELLRLADTRMYEEKQRKKLSKRLI